MEKNIRTIVYSLVFVIILCGCNFSSSNSKELAENDGNTIDTLVKGHYISKEEHIGLVDKRGKNSLEYFNKAIELQRKNGFFLSTEKDTQIYVESARLIKKAILLDSSRLNFYINLSKIYFRLDYKDEAIQALEELLLIDSNYVEAITSLGFMLEKYGYKEDADIKYQESLQIYSLRLNKTYKDYINRCFLIMLLSGNDSAIKALEQVEVKFPNEDVAFFKYQFKNFNRRKFVESSLK